MSCWFCHNKDRTVSSNIPLILSAPAERSAVSFVKYTATQEQDIKSMNVSANTSSPRAGFTIVEVLVVIAIIGILIALLMPAINSVRQSARVKECQNNLRQIGVALYGYETSFEHLPKDGENDWGYAAFILPQVEQQPLYDSIQPARNVRDPIAHKPQIDTELSLFRCPLFSQKDPRLPDGTGRSTYVGNDELFSYGAMLEDIQDGASNTVLVSETKEDQGWALPREAGAADGSRHPAGHNLLYADGSVRLEVPE